MLLLAIAAASAADTWSDPHPAVHVLERTGNGQRVYAAYVDLCEDVTAQATRYEERRQTTSAWASSQGAVVAINGAFFSYTDYDAIGWSIGRGQTWPTAVDYPHYTAVAFASYGRARIFDTEDTFPPPNQPWWTEMVPGDPLLVDDGLIVTEACYSHMCERHPRSAVGLTADGSRAILVAVDGRDSPAADGMTRAELATLMQDLGAWRAMNFDGGGSTALWVAGQGVLNQPSDGTERVVSSHLGFVPTTAPTCCRHEAVPDATGVFADLPDDAWSKPYAEALYAAGITSGCQQSPLLFCPTCVLDRATLAVFVARAMGLAPVAETQFTDVPADAWYAGYVQALANAGVTQGCGTGLFCPERLATRYEAAALVARGSGLAPWTGPSRFTDVSDAQADAVDALADACVIAGCGTDTFCPDDEVTREQVAKIVAVAFSVPPYAPCLPQDTDVNDTSIDTEPADTDVETDVETDVAVDTEAPVIDPVARRCGCQPTPASSAAPLFAWLSLLTARRAASRARSA